MQGLRVSSLSSREHMHPALAQLGRAEKPHLPPSSLGANTKTHSHTSTRGSIANLQSKSKSFDSSMHALEHHSATKYTDCLCTVHLESTLSAAIAQEEKGARFVGKSTSLEMIPGYGYELLELYPDLSKNRAAAAAAAGWPESNHFEGRHPRTLPQTTPDLVAPKHFSDIQKFTTRVEHTHPFHPTAA